LQRGIWRWNAVFGEGELIFLRLAGLPPIPFWRASSSVSSPKPAELRVRARRFCADLLERIESAGKARPAIAGDRGFVRRTEPGLFRML